MISHNILSIPLIIKTQKYYASHSEKKSYLTLTMERGNNTFPTPSSFSLVLVSRLFASLQDVYEHARSDNELSYKLGAGSQ